MNHETRRCPTRRSARSLMAAPPLAAALALLSACGPAIGWQTLGEEQRIFSNVTELFSPPSVAVDSNGGVALAWIGGEASHSGAWPVVRRWNAGQWRDITVGLVDGQFYRAGPGTRMAVALNAVNQPVVAWTRVSDDGSSMDFEVARYDDTQADWKLRWERFGAGVIASLRSEPARRLGSPALVLDPLGFPIVAWQETTANYDVHLYAARWNGSAWLPLGSGPIFTDTQWSASNELSLMLDGSGQPAVAWTISPQSARLFRWNGSAWHEGPEDLPADFSEGYFALPGVAFSGDTVMAATSSSPVVRDSPGRVAVQRWTGSAWERLGTALVGLDDPHAQAVRPTLVMDAHGNPVVSWTETPEGSNTAFMFVRRWTGSEWKDLGRLHALNSDTGIRNATMAINARGQIVTAWRETDGANSTLRVSMHPGS